MLETMWEISWVGAEELDDGGQNLYKVPVIR